MRRASNRRSCEYAAPARGEYNRSLAILAADDTHAPIDVDTAAAVAASTEQDGRQVSPL
jgi:hypothetical protein